MENEWGNHLKNKFHQCYDDIIVYAKGNNYKFYSDKIQINKVTKNKGLNPSSRQTKTATAWIDDICLTTTAKERIKLKDGHLIKWQKPVRLLRRLMYPFLNMGDLVVDPFCGTATSGVIAQELGCNYIGIELDQEICNIARNRLGC